MDLVQKIKSLNLPRDKYVVGGGSALEIYGIRKATDIDIAVTQNLYKKLKFDGWKERAVNGNKGLVKGNFDVAIGYMCGDKKISMHQLLKTSVVINGIPCTDLKTITKIKKSLGRKKDKKDISLIKKFQEHSAGGSS